MQQAVQYVEYSANTELTDTATFNPANVIFSVPRENKTGLKFYRVYISTKNESGTTGKHQHSVFKKKVGC